MVPSTTLERWNGVAADRRGGPLVVVPLLLARGAPLAFPSAFRRRSGAGAATALDAVPPSTSRTPLRTSAQPAPRLPCLRAASNRRGALERGRAAVGRGDEVGAQCRDVLGDEVGSGAPVSPAVAARRAASRTTWACPPSATQTATRRRTSPAPTRATPRCWPRSTPPSTAWGALAEGRDVAIPAAGLGAGLAEPPTLAPTLHALVDTRVAALARMAQAV